MAAPKPFSDYHDTLREIATERATEVLKDKLYQHTQIKTWIRTICDNILEEALKVTGKSFKICVNTVLMQNDHGSGVCSHASAFWDPSQDGVVTLSVMTEHVAAIIAIYGISV